MQRRTGEHSRRDSVVAGGVHNTNVWNSEVEHASSWKFARLDTIRFRARFISTVSRASPSAARRWGRCLRPHNLSRRIGRSAVSTGHFLRAAQVALPIEYAIEAVHDGRRSGARRVLGIQDGKRMFDLPCAFRDPELGVTHQFVMPVAAPPPETLAMLQQLAVEEPACMPRAMRTISRRPFPIEIRPLDPGALFRPARRHGHAGSADPLSMIDPEGADSGRRRTHGLSPAGASADRRSGLQQEVIVGRSAR